MNEKEKKELSALESLTTHGGGDRSVGNVIAPSGGTRQPENEISSIGWFDVNRTDMPWGGVFYDRNWRFQVRSATAEEIRHFSAIDNESPLSVNDGINQLLSTCFRILEDNKKLSYKNLNEVDRFFFVLYIRHYTFPEPEKILSFPEICSSCGHGNTPKLDWHIMEYKPITEKSEKYWNSDTISWELPTKSFGVLSITPTTIYKANCLRAYTIQLAKDKKTIDLNFAKIYWMLMTPEEAYNEKIMPKIYERYRDLSPNKLGLYLQLLPELELTPSQEIKYICENESCADREVRTLIQFPGGINHIFFTTNLDSELL